MSYNKRTWATGNVVGAVDLNRIENGIADIDVDEIRGWGVSSTQLFSESVTTEVDPEYPDDPAFATLSYATQITADTLKVKFDGTDYVCTKINADIVNVYGDDSFADYPFVLESFNMGENTFRTQTAGTHTVVAVAETTEVSDAFSATVGGVVATSQSVPLKCVLYETTYAEMLAAQNAGRLMYVYINTDNCVIINSVPDNATTGTVGYYPVTQGLTLRYNIGGKLIAQV